MSKNPLIKIFGSIGNANLLFDVINDYVINTYKYKCNHLLKTMYRYKIMKILSYVDPESNLYDENILPSNKTLTYGFLYNRVSSVFCNKYWDDLKLIEKKRQSVKNMKEPNTNIVCKKCNKKQIYLYEKQVRCADEAMTQFYNCLNCGNKWSF